MASPFINALMFAATSAQKSLLGALDANNVTQTELAGETIVSVLLMLRAMEPPIGGLKVSTKNGWFAGQGHPAQKMCTKSIWKVFISEEHLAKLEEEAKALVNKVLDN